MLNLKQAIEIFKRPTTVQSSAKQFAAKEIDEALQTLVEVATLVLNAEVPKEKGVAECKERGLTYDYQRFCEGYNQALQDSRLHTAKITLQLLEALKDFRYWYINFGRYNPDGLIALKKAVPPIFNKLIDKMEQAISSAEKMGKEA